MKEISITSFENLKIGQAENSAAGTGCTVFLLGKNGAPTGLDVRGGGPASRESELLHPLAAAQVIHPQLLLLPSSNAPADTSISFPHSQTQCQSTEPLWSLCSVGYMAVSSPNFCPLRSLGLLPILIPILILFLNFVEYTTLRKK